MENKNQQILKNLKERIPMSCIIFRGDYIFNIEDEIQFRKFMMAKKGQIKLPGLSIKIEYTVYAK